MKSKQIFQNLFMDLSPQSGKVGKCDVWTFIYYK